MNDCKKKLGGTTTSQLDTLESYGSAYLSNRSHPPVGHHKSHVLIEPAAIGQETQITLIISLLSD
jgi:hypothetical protein